MYIAIEGIDTSGKSTQIELLSKKYPNAIITKEPGGTSLGSILRNIVLNHTVDSTLSEMFIFLADRAEHTKQIILPNINNKTIISDRSLVSGIAYASNMKLQELIDLNLLATKNTLPSHVIFLKLPKVILKKRLETKKQDIIESRGIEYLLTIQNRIEETIKKLKLNYIAIDASKNILFIQNQIEDFLNA